MRPGVTHAVNYALSKGFTVKRVYRSVGEAGRLVE